MAKDLSFLNPEAHAAQFIEGLRDGTVIAPQNLLKILPVVFEEAIARIFSELDYERNLKCNTAIAVRLLGIWAARAKDSLGGSVAKTQAQAEPLPIMSPESLRLARKLQSLPSRELAIVRRILTRFLSWPPDAGPIAKEQVVRWLKAEGDAESVIYSYLKSMEAVERNQDQP